MFILAWVAFALAIPGGALLLGYQFAVFARFLCPVGVLATLAGTAYWVLHARHGPDWDRELVGLVGLFTILADLMIFSYALYVVCDGFRP